ncbi:MAG TPA: FmdB family zinc ribbon protein [Solirubrobacterales bacterium]
MPIYEYKCENGHVFDAIQKMTDEPLTECQECGAPASRVLSAPAIHFKGSGFHNTDYGTRKSGANGGSSEGGSDSSSSKPDSGKSESKTDSKPAASTAD